MLDVVMPRLGGTATADKLLVRFPDLRVIFTSGYSRDIRTANQSPRVRERVCEMDGQARALRFRGAQRQTLH